MAQSGTNKHDWDSRPRRRTGSLFGPIVLIALGLYFLAGNMGLTPQLHWGAALHLWPLFLIFVGLNIIARQIPRPLGTLATAAVALLFVVVFGAVLFFADRLPFLAQYSGTAPTVQTETVSLPISEVRTANISIDFAAPKATLFGLDDSTDLIAGEISYQGELVFEHEISQGNMRVNLETHMNDDDWVNWLNPSNWDGNGAGWRIGLSPRVPMSLSLDFASGAIEADLQDLQLTSLTVDGSSGSAVILLPNGDYTMDYDVASGAVQMTLPERGRVELVIEGSSGSVVLFLPDSMAMRVILDSSSGSFQPGDRLEQISEEDDNEIWTTDDYAQAENRLDVQMEMASGSFQIREAASQ